MQVMVRIGREHLAEERPMIRRISTITSVGRFKAFRAPSDLPDLAQRVVFFGSNGHGKSTLVAQMVGEYSRSVKAGANGYKGRCGVVAFDPMSPLTSGALLGDRLRVDFNSLDESVYYRSLAISGEDYHALSEVIELIGGAFEGDDAIDTLFVETVGAGQNETMIRKYVDKTAVVLVPGMGDAIQMDKAGILEIADLFVCNKADHPGQNELMRDLREVAGRKPVLETVASRGQGIPELLAACLS